MARFIDIKQVLNVPKTPDMNAKEVMKDFVALWTVNREPGIPQLVKKIDSTTHTQLVYPFWQQWVGYADKYIIPLQVLRESQSAEQYRVHVSLDLVEKAKCWALHHLGCDIQQNDDRLLVVPNLISDVMLTRASNEYKATLEVVEDHVLAQYHIAMTLWYWLNVPSKP